MLMLFMTFFPWRLFLVCGTEDLHLCGAKPLASFWLLLFAGDICVVDQLAVSLLVGTLSCTLVSRGLSTNSFWWRAVWCCCGVFVEHSWNCRRRWSSPRTCAWTWKIRRLEKVCIFLHLVCPWLTDITWLRDVTVGLLIVCTVGASVGGVGSLLRACRASCEPLSASLPCLNTVGPKLKKSPELLGRNYIEFLFRLCEINSSPQCDHGRQKPSKRSKRRHDTYGDGDSVVAKSEVV